MTDDQHNHLAGILEDFTELAIDKYTAGQKEHGGNLWQKKGLIDMAIDEAIDQFVYLTTLKRQLEEAGVELGLKDEN